MIDRRTFAGTFAALAALGVAGAGGSAGAAPDSGHCGIRPLVEPPHTRGRSNTIRWEAVPADCWFEGSTDRRFVVTVTNATGEKDTVTVNGRDSVQATVGPDDFPGSAIDGQRFRYLVSKRERVCVHRNVLRQCIEYDTFSHDALWTVVSTQDDRAPTGTLTLAGPFTGTLDARAQITATDPGGPAASGLGYVAFSGSGALRRGGCPAFGCAEPLTPGLSSTTTTTVRLEPGPDGIRTVEARLYDRARGPSSDPGETTIGVPPGNVSAPLRGTVFLDRTAPYIFIRISTVRVTMGAPVTFDASQTVDPNGSGVLPQSGEWTFGDGGVARGLVATHTYTRTGRFPFIFSVADQVGNAARTQPVEIEVLAAPVPAEPRSTETPPQGGTPQTVDRQPPTFSALSVRRRAGRTTVAFRLSERATVRVEVRRQLPRPVRRTATLSRQLAAGRRGIVLPAAATRKRGRYAIVLVARDRAGNVSRARTLTLTRR